LTQYISIKDRICSKRCLSCYLPENIRSLCATAQNNICGGTYSKVLRYLENPDIIRATRESNICGYCYISTLFIESRSERHSTDISSTQFSSSGACPSSGVSVGSFHIVYRCSHCGWGRSRVVGCIYFSGY